MSSTALLTDHYELTMLDAALRDGTAERTCVFETFARRLPDGRRFGVVAGLGRLIDAIERFRFGDAELGYLDDHDVVSPPTLDWLATYRFRGQLDAYREGEIYLPNSPVLTVRGTFAEAILLETLLLSVLNHDSAIASAAARMVWAAEGRPLMEFGSRRTHEDAAVAAARAAYVAGFAGTSNLEAGRRYGIPTLGTTAHAFTLLHGDEDAAFRSQVTAHGADTTLLVDTYGTVEGIERAVVAGGTGLGAIRIDSGDLAATTERARSILDARGASGTSIVLSGDLDEYELLRLRDVPADSYGLGTRLVTGSGAPTSAMVYKLVARSTSPEGPLEPVAKLGGDKATVGGHKAAWRRTVAGTAVVEVLRPWDAPTPSGDGRDLQVPVLRDGERCHAPTLEEIRAHHAMAIAELPAAARALDPGEVAVPTRHELP